MEDDNVTNPRSYCLTLDVDGKGKANSEVNLDHYQQCIGLTSLLAMLLLQRGL